MDDKKLYHITGDDPHLVKQVQDAMDWLLSDAAEDIGQDLLKTAYAEHGNPVEIVVSGIGRSGYNPHTGTMYINPKRITSALIQSDDGVPQSMSVERALAHELVHVGEPTDKILAYADQRKEARRKVHIEVEANIGQETIERHTQSLLKAIGAQDYETARRHIGDYVDHVALPLEKGIKAQLPDMPEFQAYLDVIEAPAIAMENRVAVLRGEPIRASYQHSHEIPDPIAREALIDEHCVGMEIVKPKHQSSRPANKWQKLATADRGTTILTSQHSRIATHQSGGRGSNPTSA